MLEKKSGLKDDGKSAQILFHSENMGVDAKELGDLCIHPYCRAQGNMFE